MIFSFDHRIKLGFYDSKKKSKLDLTEKNDGHGFNFPAFGDFKQHLIT